MIRWWFDKIMICLYDDLIWWWFDQMMIWSDDDYENLPQVVKLLIQSTPMWPSSRGSHAWEHHHHSRALKNHHYRHHYRYIMIMMKGHFDMMFWIMIIIINIIIIIVMIMMKGYFEMMPLGSWRNIPFLAPPELTLLFVIVILYQS